MIIDSERSRVTVTPTLPGYVLLFSVGLCQLFFEFGEFLLQTLNAALHVGYEAVSALRLGGEESEVGLVVLDFGAFFLNHLLQALLGREVLSALAHGIVDA